MQPQAVLGYGGLTPDQVQELSRLNQLEKLSVPLSIRECIMNLPQIIFVLRCSSTYYIMRSRPIYPNVVCQLVTLVQNLTN